MGCLVTALCVSGCASPTTPSSHTLSVSSDFAEGATIPTEYTCSGTDTSPDVHVAGLPDGTKDFALVMDDPTAQGFIHWIAWNIPVSGIVK